MLKSLARRIALVVVLALVVLVLPVQGQSGPTVGLTTVGSFLDVYDSNWMTGSRITVGAQALSVTSVSAYVGAVQAAPSNQYSVAIYNDSSGAPSGLVAQSANGTLLPNTWNTLSVSATLNAGASYWLAYNTNGGSSTVNDLYFNNDPANVGVYAPRSFGSWPATFGASTLALQRYSIYASAVGSTSTATPTLGTPTVTPTPSPPTVTPTPQAVAPGSITDSSIVWSPYTWRDGGTFRESNPQNASIEFEFQADSLAIDLDTVAYTGIPVSDWPTVQWTVDSGPWSIPVTANSGSNIGGTVRRVTIASSLSAGQWHHVLLWTASNGNQNHWTGLQQRVIRFGRTSGTALVMSRLPTYTWPKNLLVFGDSIAEFGGGDLWPNPGHFHWPIGVARALNANLGLIAYEGQGWRVPPTGGGVAFHVPGDTVNQSWRWYSNGQSRSFTPPPDYVIANFGTNDQAFSAAQIQAAASDWLVGIRTATGANTQIFVMVPTGQWYHAALTAAIAASGDSHVHLIDLGVEQSLGLTGLNSPFASWRSADSEHPNADDQAELSARVVAAIRDALQGALP